LREIDRDELKVAEEHRWVTREVAGRLCCGRSLNRV
jgi:hypothetical protein